MYHRQIYKHFLTNKILKNPHQRRFFKARDMKDLFILNDDGENGLTETSNIFSQLSEEVNIVGAQKDKQHKQEHSKAAVSRTDHAASGQGNCSNTGLSTRKGKEKDDHDDGEVDEEKYILRSLFGCTRDTCKMHLFLQ